MLIHGTGVCHLFYSSVLYKMLLAVFDLLHSALKYRILC